jgi:hypothetical protein
VSITMGDQPGGQEQFLGGRRRGRRDAEPVVRQPEHEQRVAEPESTEDREHRRYRVLAERGAPERGDQLATAVAARMMGSEAPTAVAVTILASTRPSAIDPTMKLGSPITAGLPASGPATVASALPHGLRAEQSRQELR